MSLNRNNPFVASLSTLVEPFTPESATSVQTPAGAAGGAEPHHATLLERFESWAALGQTLGRAPDASSESPLDEAAVQLRRRQLAPYYYSYGRNVVNRASSSVARSIR
jgi:hypothetical protein